MLFHHFDWDLTHHQNAKKLSDPKTSSKTYWSILKTFYNTKKVPIIPPILIENKLETDFLKKANYFNKFFASKCTPLSNSSSLPSSLDLETEARLTSINFSDNDILKIIRSLDINKAHGHDDISVRMVKICNDFIKKLLSIIYKNCITTGISPSAWKKSNIVPVHKKKDKQFVSNCRPVSLLPIFSRVLEKILFNSIFEYLFTKNSIFEYLFTISQRIVFFVITNQVFDLLIHVSINYFLLFMIFMHLLIVTHPKM